MMASARNSWCSIGLGLVAITGLSCRATDAVDPGELTALLRGCHAASGWTSGNASTRWQVRGTSHEQGLDGSFDLQFDGRGRFVLAIDSALGAAAGFDGTTCWARDEAGITRTVDFGERAESLCARWVQTGHWIQPEQDRFAFGLIERSRGRIRLALQHVETPFRAELTLDPETLLPRELVHHKPTGTRRIEFFEWSATDGGPRLPRRTHVTDVGGDESIFTIQTAERVQAIAASPPRSRPSTARFDPQLSPRVEARVAPSGHLLVRARLDDRAEWFLLDSGAGSVCIDRVVADELGLPRRGYTSVSGTGGSLISPYRPGATLAIGPLEVSDLPWLELDLSFMTEPLGVEIAGVLGYELFARATVVMDHAAASVELHPPSSTAFDDLPWSELRFDGRTPCALARYEGEREGWFRLDSGSDETVIFHGPAVRAQRLLTGRETTRRVAGGVGGLQTILRGELAWFELGGQRFERPRVAFFGGGASLLDSPFQTGNVGCGFLSSFRVVWDYERSRVAWLPKSAD